MKVACSLLVLLFLRGGMSAVVRKPPAFSKPTYSDSYLPAAMQVIFHTVEQLKLLQSEEAQQNTSTSFIPVSMITQTTTLRPPGTTSSTNEETNSNSSLVSQMKPMESTAANAETQASSTEAMAKPSLNESHNETPEVNEETPETYYATPEASHESPEVIHGVQEANHEIPEENHETTAQILAMTEAKESSTMETKTEASSIATVEDDQGLSTVERNTEAVPGSSATMEMDSSTMRITTEASTSRSSVSTDADENLSTVEKKTEASVPGSSATMEMDSSTMRMSTEASISLSSVSTDVDESLSTEEMKTEASEASTTRPNSSAAVDENLSTLEMMMDVSIPQSSSPTVTTKNPLADADKPNKKEPTIDSIVEEIYEIVKPTPSNLLEETDVFEESKSSPGISLEKLESIEEADDETRFTLLGEKVTQVPRPSLSSYLRRAKVPASASLQQLAALYDALSKDARKQGFGRYSGYSDEVLETLRSSAEGGVGPQLKVILGKVLERNELTRDDAKMKTSQALRDLDEPSSSLSKDLRRLLPLRYAS